MLLIGFAAFFLAYLTVQVFPTFQFKPFNCIFCMSVWLSFFLSPVYVVNMVNVKLGFWTFIAQWFLNFAAASGLATFIASMMGYRYGDNV